MSQHKCNITYVYTLVYGICMYVCLNGTDKCCRRLQDYPSVGQINFLLRRFDIIPIFAAEAAARPFYEVSNGFFFMTDPSN